MTLKPPKDGLLIVAAVAAVEVAVVVVVDAVGVLAVVAVDAVAVLAVDLVLAVGDVDLAITEQYQVC